MWRAASGRWRRPGRVSRHERGRGGGVAAAAGRPLPAGAGRGAGGLRPVRQGFRLSRGAAVVCRRDRAARGSGDDVRMGGILALFASLQGVVLALAMAWTLARTLPYLSGYGFDAPRDSMIIMYGALAFIV